MKESEEGMHSQANQDATPPTPPDSASEPEAPTRRELIGRYGKCAIIAAPLLVFVSKASAIHSKP